MCLKDFRERVVQAGLERTWQGADFPVHMYEMALVLPHRLDCQSHRILQQSRRRKYRRHEVRRHVKHDVGEKVLYLLFFFLALVLFGLMETVEFSREKKMISTLI